MIYLDYTANTPGRPGRFERFYRGGATLHCQPQLHPYRRQLARAEMDRVTSSIAQHLGRAAG